MYKSKIKKFCLSFTMALVILGSCNLQGAFCENYTNDETVNIGVYEKISPSIVAVDAELNDGVSSGTGIVVDAKGIILTSSHVISGSDSIEVTLSNGEKCKGKVIALMGENNDLALLKINSKAPLRTAKFGDSTKVKVGQRVLAIGNPFGFSGTLTTGIVSRIDYKRNKIQTDAAINPGSSGGPLLNAHGEIIGVSQSIYNPDNNKSNIGIGFAVPVNAAKRFVSQIKEKTNSFVTLGSTVYKYSN